MSSTWTYTLWRGHSEDPSGGACAMDAVNWLVHGKHGDQPACACPVIGRYVIGLNDAMPHDQRQRLLPFLHRIAGSRSPDHEQARAEILARGAVRVLTPLVLDAEGLTAEAARLRAMPADCTMEEVKAAAWEAKVAAAWEAKVAAADMAAAWGVKASAAYVAAVYVAGAAAAASAAAAAAAEVAGPAVWDAALALLDEALSAGPQGEPWSAAQVDAGMAAYRAAGGKVMA